MDVKRASICSQSFDVNLGETVNKVSVIILSLFPECIEVKHLTLTENMRYGL
ncbi:hypothetical protein LEWO105114_02855 [Legionella worsleiensis]|uniref:Uncharacterized protein n=1 Tax=Legionella worsleiensis TaxID=45076 RepID=A0A0W1AKX6_9GAMM|nr:hypothetical protein Lwor_0292 [Legionella worsleiensis]STY30382.1 Uncharacterised protein [Legionella worsleiensis]